MNHPRIENNFQVQFRNSCQFDLETARCHTQGASREMDVFEMDVTEQVEGVEAWVGGQLNSSGHAISVAVMPQCTSQHRVFAHDSFVKSGESIIGNSEALLLLFHYQASREHSKSQYHLEVGHIFSNKRNDNEEETTWSCRNGTNPGERGKSARSHREESNPFCSATCCRVRNGRKRSMANLTKNGM